MTMTVDGKSVMKVIKKSSSAETNTKDPLYLGGVPEGYVTRGLDTRGSSLLLFYAYDCSNYANFRTLRRLRSCRQSGHETAH